MKCKTIFFALLLCVPTLAKDPVVTPAPLPAKILEAKKIFIINGGGSEFIYDAFYSAMRSWKRYELLSSPEGADLIFNFQYLVPSEGTHVWSTTNTYSGATNVHSSPNLDPQVRLEIVDPTSKTALWTVVAHQELARREKNRVKNRIKVAQDAVTKLRQRVEN